MKTTGRWFLRGSIALTVAILVGTCGELLSARYLQGTPQTSEFAQPGAAASTTAFAAVPPHQTSSFEKQRIELQDDIAKQDRVLEKLKLEKIGLLTEANVEELDWQKQLVADQLSHLRERKVSAEAECTAAEARAGRFTVRTRTDVTAESDELQLVRGNRLEAAEREDPLFRAALAEQVAASQDYWKQLGSGKTEAHRDVIIAKRRALRADEAVKERKAQLAASVEAGAVSDARMARSERTAEALGRVDAARARVAAVEKAIAELSRDGKLLDTQLSAAEFRQHRIMEIDAELGRVTQAREAAWQESISLKAGISAEAETPVRVPPRSFVQREPIVDVRSLARAGSWGAGILLGALALRVLCRFDRRSLEPRALAQALGVPVLGSLPCMQERDQSESAGDQMADAIRAIRAGILVRGELDSGARTVCITSPLAGDGRTTLSVALGMSLAMTGRRVLLVDASFSRPDSHGILPLAATPGLAEVLEGRATLESAITASSTLSLDMLPTGLNKAAAADLLSSPALVALIRGISRRYDHIIIDSPTLLDSDDGHWMLGQFDGVLCVASCAVKETDHNRISTLLRTGNQNFLGLVVNPHAQRRRQKPKHTRQGRCLESSSARKSLPRPFDFH